MQTLLQDVRHGIRMLRRAPGFALAALLALALGIGANTLIFSTVNAMLLRPLPYPDPDQLAFVSSTHPERKADQITVSLEDFGDWREQNQVFEGMAALMADSLALTAAMEPLQLKIARVSPVFFDLLGVAPEHGRGFRPDEEQVGRHRVVVLGHGLWARQFGSDPGLVGRTVSINSRPYEVVGIAPPGFQFPDAKVEAWVPLAFAAGPPNRGTRYLTVIGRMKAGETATHATAEMEAIARRLEAAYPENAGLSAVVVPFRDRLLGAVRPAMWLLLGAVALVLFIACANVANLLLARSTARRREMALRAALGAGRGRLVRQLLTESALLALTGGAIGTLLAAWGLKLLPALAPEEIPRLGEAVIDGRVLAFTTLLSVLTAGIFGLLPARQAARADLTESLREGARGSLSSRGARRSLRLLVVGEVALSLMLLVGAGLLLNSFQRLRSVDPGFNPDQLLTVQVSLPYSKYGETRQRAEFFRQALEGIRAVPGVISAGATNDLPFASTEFNRYFMMAEIEGGASRSWSTQEPPVAVFEVTPDYFRAMGTPLRSGRAFEASDDASAAPVVIVNEVVARRYFPGGDGVGRKIRLGAPESWGPWHTIVGVVGETRLEKLTQAPFPEVYTAHAQGTAIGGSQTMILAVRAAGDPDGLAAAVRTQVHAVDRDQPLGEFRTMHALLGRALTQPRFQTVLVGAFAALALLLAAIGIYGVIAYSVRTRTTEIGIRVAMGARGVDILRLILREGSAMILLGIGLGTVGALALSRILAGFLFGVGATDPLTFGAVSALLLAVGLLACYLPARRASKLDPMAALRFE